MRILFILFILIQSLTANSIPVFGIVKDSLLNRTLEGVNILSGSNGTSTDNQGVFIIDAETDYLTISHIGFKTVKILAKDTIYVNLVRDIILSDEIYSELSFDEGFKSISSFCPEKTIISTGLSKWCGAGGWRLGYFIVPDSCLLYTSPSPRDLSTSRMPSSA